MMKHLIDSILNIKYSKKIISPINLRWLLKFGKEKVDINYNCHDQGNSILESMISLKPGTDYHATKLSERKIISLTKELLKERKLDITCHNHNALRIASTKDNKRLYFEIKEEYMKRGIAVPNDLDLPVLPSHKMNHERDKLLDLKGKENYDKAITIIAEGIGYSLGDVMAAWRLVKQCLRNNNKMNFILFCDKENPFEYILSQNIQSLTEIEKSQLKTLYLERNFSLDNKLKINNSEVNSLLQSSSIVLPYPRLLFLNQDERKFIRDNNIIFSFLGEYDFERMNHIRDNKYILAPSSTGFEENNKGIFIDTLKSIDSLVIPSFIKHLRNKLTSNTLTNKYSNLFFGYFHLSVRTPIVFVNPFLGTDWNKDKENFILDQPNIANYIDYAIEQGNANDSKEIFIVAPFKNFNNRLEKVLSFIVKTNHTLTPNLESLKHEIHDDFLPVFIITNHNELYCYGSDRLGNPQLVKTGESKFKDQLLYEIYSGKNKYIYQRTNPNDYSVNSEFALPGFNTNSITEFLEFSGVHFEKSNKLWVDEYIQEKGLNYQMEIPNKSSDSIIQYIVKRNGLTAYLVDPFPLSTDEFITTMQLSDNPVLITGDQSLSDSISQNKVFLYQIMPWKIDLFYEMVNFMESKGLFYLSKFMLSQQNPKNSAIKWKDILLDKIKVKQLREQTEQFREYVAKEKNAYIEVPKWINAIKQHSRESLILTNASNISDTLKEFVEKGNLKAVRFFLEDMQGDPNIQDSSNNPIISTALRNQQEEIVKLFISKGSDVKAIDSSGVSLLEISVRNNRNLAMSEFLLSQGADPNTTDHTTNAPLLSILLSQFQKEGAKLLINYGADPNAVGLFAHNILSRAYCNDMKEVFELLLIHGANANVADKNEKPLLIKTLSKYETEYTQLLLTYGANPNTTDASGTSALEIADSHDMHDTKNLIKYFQTHDCISMPAPFYTNKLISEIACFPNEKISTDITSEDKLGNQEESIFLSTTTAT